jgi:DNA-binding transcriptional regulator LsrR (DeoR family)
MVETEDSANILKSDPNIRDALLLGKSCDLAILGVGSTKPDFCSLYQGDHITKSDLERISRQNAVGDVSGHYFDIHGNRSDVEFHKRLIGISDENLRKVPIRLGAAGGIEKSEAILGALRGGYLNYLITDNQSAEKVLELAGME